MQEAVGQAGQSREDRGWGPLAEATPPDASRPPSSNDRRLIDAARREAEEERRSGVPVSDSDPGLPPDSFPGYELTREVHRGGQGVVYQAVQKATRRKVAIKVLREGPFAGARDRARFEREVQILAGLNHPGIVAIHDSGSAAGRVFFVMDYVSGQPLDIHAASVDQDVRGVLVLFAKVCRAVNAAHLRGVIHRDLKPSNILVDPAGEPHILDFGLAKSGLWSAEPGVTQTGQFVGSLPWASPEQAEGDPNHIDVRTDVYSLGVILYHMLTGRFPYRVTGPLREVLDQIARGEPIRPRAHKPAIDDEVEAVVLKCLSKDRERRYQTAGEVACDLERYLAGEPIEAKRDSAWYVLSKALRHYRRHAAMAVAFVVLAVAGFGGSVVLWRRAETEATRAANVRDLLFAMMDTRNPWSVTGPADRQAMLASGERLAEEYRDQPRVRADCLEALAGLYAGFGREPDAVRCLAEAVEIRRSLLGPRHPALARTLIALATNRAGDRDGAQSALRECDEALEILESDPGTRPEVIADTRHLRATILYVLNDYEGAWNAVVDNGVPVLLLVTWGREHSLTPALAEMVAECRRLVAAGDREGIRRHCRRYTDQVTRELGSLWRAGRHEDAYRLISDHCAPYRGWPLFEAALPGALCDAGVFLSSLGEPAEVVEPIFRASITMTAERAGPGHPQVARVRARLGRALLEARPAIAEPELRQALAVCREKLAADDPAVHDCLSALGALLVNRGQIAEAEPLVREACAIARAGTGVGAMQRRRTFALMADVHEKMDRPREAEEYRRAARDPAR